MSQQHVPDRNLPPFRNDLESTIIMSPPPARTATSKSREILWRGTGGFPLPKDQAGSGAPLPPSQTTHAEELP